MHASRHLSVRSAWILLLFVMVVVMSSAVAASAGTFEGAWFPSTTVTPVAVGGPAIAIEVSTNGQDADSAPGPTIPFGTPVTWTYVVTNVGDISLTNVVITDDQLGTIGAPFSLGPGESASRQASGVAGVGQYANVGSVTADSVAGPLSDSDPSHYYGEGISVDLEVATNGLDADSPPGPLLEVGDFITWTYTITNTGDVAFDVDDLVDSELGSILLYSGPIIIRNMGPGQSITLQALGTAVPGQYSNNATVTVTASGGGSSASDSDRSHYLTDAFAPTTTDDVAAAGWRSSDVTVTLEATDEHSGVAATYYSIDGAPKVLYSGPFAITEEGEHDITYWSVDVVGNIEDPQHTATIKIDKTAPTIATSQIPASGWASGAALMWAEGYDDLSYVGSIQYSIQFGPLAIELGPTFMWSTSAEGLTVVDVWAVDAAGNISSPETVFLLVDNTAPTTTDDAPTTWVSSDTTVALSATDMLSGPANSYYYIDGGATQTYADPFPIVGEGVHEIVYWSVDHAGNIEQAKSATVRIDRTGPVVTDDSTSGWQTGPVTVSFTEADAGVDFSTFHYVLDGSGEATTAASMVVSGTGVHELEYWGVDSLGNAGPHGHATIRVDDETPLSGSDIDSAWQNGPVEVTIDAADAHSGVGSIDATVTDPPPGGTTPLSAVSDTMTFTVSAEGTTTVAYYATDAVGNMEIPKTEIVRIDDTAPVVSILPTVTTAIDAVTFNVSVVDPLSGVDAVYISLDGAAAVATDTVRIDTVGDHTVTYWAVDVAGNESAHATHGVRVSPSQTDYEQIAGTTRYETAVAASQHSFPAGSDAVIIATGANWPDALGGAALAGVYDAPVLLTRADVLPDAVAAEIERLDPNHVFVLGGTNVISEDIESQIRALIVPTANLERFWGADRYTTVQIIAARAVRAADAFDGTAFVATGRSFPDALAAAPLATSLQRPLYLAGPSGLSAETLTAMGEAGVTDVVVLGGTSAVSGAVEGQLTGAGISHVRMAGADRYATAIMIAESGVAEGLSWNKVALACADTFPDALSGGVMQGHDGSVMLLTDCYVLDARVRDTLAAQRDIIGEVRYLGGPSAVSQAVRDAVSQVLR